MLNKKSFFKHSVQTSLIGMSILGVAALQPAAASEMGYAVDSMGDVVRTNYGECWKVKDGLKKKIAACGDVVDADGDGVSDDLDQCPKTAAGTQVDAKGCALDSDGDGIANDLDQCPGTSAGAKTDSKGCALDADGDGVADNFDRCPGTPAGASVNGRGCAADLDGDGITDHMDRCPGTPVGIEVDATGCASVVGKVFTANLVGDEFASNSTLLKPAMKAALDKLAAQIVSAGTVTTVTVIGHTDSMGEAGYNQTLSEGRAKSTADYLISRGVDASFITSSGAGESTPIADNRSAKGRAKNRRTEIHIK